MAADQRVGGPDRERLALGRVRDRGLVMALLNRYVHHVRKHLPKAQRDDIAAEISEMLASQIEGRQAELGRPLTEEEEAALLKRFGHPLIVAGRYGSREYLIGPAIYPFYCFVLRVAAWIGAPLIVFLLLMTALTSEEPYRQVPLTFWILSNVALAAFGLVTLVFARLERLKDQFDLPQAWDPRDLSRAPDSREPRSRWEPVGSLLAVAFYFLWWIDILPLGRLNQWMGGSPSGVDLAPVWQALNPAIVTLMVATMAADALRIARPQAMRFHESLWLVIQLAVLVVIYQLVLADALMVPVADPPTALAPLFETMTRVGLSAIGVATLASTFFTVRRLVLLVRPRTPATLSCV